MFGQQPKQRVKAKILADEGYKMAMNSGTVALQHQKYIVEVHPDGEPAFRTEVTAWVHWTQGPRVGDVLEAEYRPGSQKAELCIKGDPRYDWEMKRDADAARAQATRADLLNGPVSQEPLT